jgi:DNA (cytosine-5)-methyltransferase 1
MDYSTQSLTDLKALCRSRGIKGFSTKKKAELIELLNTSTEPQLPLSKEPAVVSVGGKRALSLFSGAGGDSCGLEQAGWTVTYFSEFNEKATRTHLAAFPASSLMTSPTGSTNIKEIGDDVFAPLKGTIDLIFAGFPCQGFSHAGKKRTDDPRNELVHEFVRATRIIQPQWIIGENVKGLLSRTGVYPAGSKARPVIEIIKELFHAIGYEITYRIIDAVEVGVPQRRKRLILIGHRGTDYPHAPWSDVLHIAEPMPGIRGLLSNTLEGAMEFPAVYRPEDAPERFWMETTEEKASGTPHPNLVRLVRGIRNLSTKERVAAGLQDAKVAHVEPKGLISFGCRASSYHGQILDPDAPSKTIICAYNQCPRLFVGLKNQSTGQYWIRCLTPLECGLIQGFPRDYPWQGSDKDKITQIGNAVPPPLARTIANKILPRITFHAEPQHVDKKIKDEEEDEDQEEEDA